MIFFTPLEIFFPCISLVCHHTSLFQVQLLSIITSKSEMARYTIMKIFAIRTKNKLMPHILMHCRAIGKITNQPIYMRTPFIFPYGTMIEWVTIFKSKKESLYSFNYDFEHTFLLQVQLPSGCSRRLH